MAASPIRILVCLPDGTLLDEHLLGEGTHAIGRDDHCAISLSSEFVSREHARLILEQGSLHIEDLGSTSGTLMDGARVHGILPVQVGQHVQVGDLILAFRLWEENQSKPGNNLGGGRFILQRTLGRGGRGEVWLARDEELGEDIALKRLPPELAGDANALDELKREVLKSRRLSHPNIIRIHDFITVPGEPPFLTLEFVDGSNLTEIRLQQPQQFFTWDSLERHMVQLCEALDYAHSQQIIHRDLKPANMMIDGNGNLKLADFGIAASIADTSSRASFHGKISGTSLYMSPQQMRGEVPQPTDDVYALGATLYELLTSRPPFYTGDIGWQVQNERPKPLGDRLDELNLANDIPNFVSAIVLACLAKESCNRPASAAVVGEWIQSAHPSAPPSPAQTAITAISSPVGQDATQVKQPSPPTQNPNPTNSQPSNIAAPREWGNVETVENPAHRYYSIFLGVLFLLLLLSLKDAPREKLAGGLFGILILIVLLTLIGRFFIKTEKFSCGICGASLKTRTPVRCPSCDTELT